MVTTSESERLVIDAKSVINMMRKSLEVKDNILNIDLNEVLLLSPQLYESLLKQFEETLPYFSLAVEDSFLKKDIQLRFFNANNNIDISRIRVNHINNFISVKGIIKRITKVIPRTHEITYQCGSCGTVIKILQLNKKVKQPAKCSCGRRGGFTLTSEKQVDIQELNLEESQENLEGKQAQQLRVYLEGSLTDKDFASRLQAGRRVELLGYIKKLPAFMTAKDEDSNLSEFMLYANNIILLDAEDDIKISEEDELQIKEIAAKKPLDFLARNLVPEVYGNDMVKRAIILQMVKGVPKYRTDGSQSQSDIHILITGDVGISKSVTLKAATSRTPKAKMVVGTKTSKVGLGAMAVHDELLNCWSLEAGALVLANGSTLCIDELDKMYKEHLNDLLEPMSAGTATINRAGISATLPARTSILAAANPINGNYDLKQHLAKQIDLPTPIINRFDLIFILLDKPDKNFDANVVEHIFKGFKEKMKCDITPELYRKYIIYCRKQHPKLKEELLQPIKEFYVNLRQKSQRGDDGEKGIPVNLRGMEALIKLSEANAKLRLSEWVEIEDLNVAKEIVLFCLRQIGYDEESRVYDMSRITEKVPTSQRGKLTNLIEILRALEEKYGKFLPYKEILMESEKSNIKKWDLSNYLEQLKKEGILIEPKQGYYQLV